MPSLKTFRLLAALGVFATAVPAASAEDAPATAPEALPPWNKVCNTDQTSKRSICLTIQDVRADTGQSIVSVSLRQVTGDPKVYFVAAVPMGMIIPPGMRIQIDKNEPIDIKYQSCFGNACYGEIEASEAFLGTLKNGSQLTITTVNQRAKSMNFGMTLAGFTKAFDGDGMDPPAYQDLLRKAQEARSAASRNKLLDELKGSAQEGN